MEEIYKLSNILKILQRSGLKGLTNKQILFLLYKLDFCSKISPPTNSKITWKDLLQSTTTDLTTITQTEKAYIFMFLRELIQELLRTHVRATHLLRTPDAIKNYVRLKIGNLKQEVLMLLLLDTKSQLIDKIIFKGTHNRMIVSPKEIFKQAILHATDKITIAHNHPSGIVAPSKQDLLITKNLVAAGKLLHIKVIDHIIVSKEHAIALSEEYPEIFE